MSGQPDVLARVLAIAALALTGLQMLIAHRRELWARRSANSAELRQTLTDMQGVLDNAHKPSGAAALWTTAMGFRLESMLEQVSEVPDRRLVRAALRTHRELVALRGLATPSEADLLNDGVDLTPVQEVHLSNARDGLRAARKRVSRAIRKGGKA